jgi:hemerythrin superfamily protein
MKQEKESAGPKAGRVPTGAESSPDVGERREDGVESQDALSMLKADHREVEQLFDRYKVASRRADRARIVKEVCNALTIHAILEEEVFLPCLP